MCPFSRAEGGYGPLFAGLIAVVLIVAVVAGLEYGIQTARLPCPKVNNLQPGSPIAWGKH